MRNRLFLFPHETSHYLCFARGLKEFIHPVILFKGGQQKTRLVASLAHRFEIPSDTSIVCAHLCQIPANISGGFQDYCGIHFISATQTLSVRPPSLQPSSLFYFSHKDPIKFLRSRPDACAAAAPSSVCSSIIIVNGGGGGVGVGWGGRYFGCTVTRATRRSQEVDC